MNWVLVFIFVLISYFAAVKLVDGGKANTFIDVNTSLELDGIEKALVNTNQSLEHIGDSLDKITRNDNLTPEQKTPSSKP